MAAGAETTAQKMITRPIPSSGEAMPVIGLGTWQVFDVGPGDPARHHLAEVLRLLTDAGGRMIDTSPMYGRAEAVTGDLVAEAGLRQRLFLATKVWTSGRDQGVTQMRRSAELLRSPVLDLIQIHNLLDWRTHLATLRHLKADGRVRYIGITHYTTASLSELARILETEKGIDFVQCGYSLATRDAETQLLPVAAERGVAVIVNQPFETGGMFRKVRGRAAAGLGGRIRLRQLGAALSEIPDRRSGRNLRDPGHRQARTHGRQCQGGLRPPPRHGNARAHPSALGHALSRDRAATANTREIDSCRLQMTAEIVLIASSGATKQSRSNPHLRRASRLRFQLRERPRTIFRPPLAADLL